MQSYPIHLAALAFFLAGTAHSSANLPWGHGALLYDATQASGPDSTISNNPGQWVSNIQQFNSGATTKTAITRLYPYSGSIKIECTNANNCIYSGPNQNVFVGYDTPAFGQASVAAYRSHFPNALILAIIDADLDAIPLINNDSVGIGTAGVLTAQLCADPNVDGVFFDLEPITANAFQSPGLFSLYRQTAINLASPQCQDTGHPNGRFMAVFINPNKVPDWTQVAGALGTNGYVVVGAYDVNDATPPFPTTPSLYTSSITGKIQGFMDPASIQNKITYTVAIPAASSFSEFEEYGTYDPTAPNDFSLIANYTNTVTQLGYVQSAHAIITKNAKSPYYSGMDYWSWNQYISPDPQKNWLLLPNIPSSTVVGYLQQNG